MSDSRKHPTVAFWITVAMVAALVGYPLSFGPACWSASRDRESVRGRSIFMRPYSILPPLVMCRFGETAGRALFWYADLFGEGARVAALDLMYREPPRE